MSPALQRMIMEAAWLGTPMHPEVYGRHITHWLMSFPSGSPSCKQTIMSWPLHICDAACSRRTQILQLDCLQLAYTAVDIMPESHCC